MHASPKPHRTQEITALQSFSRGSHHRLQDHPLQRIGAGHASATEIGACASERRPSISWMGLHRMKRSGGRQGRTISSEVRWMAARCRSTPCCGEAGSESLRTPAPLTGTAYGQSRRLGVPDGLSPLHGGSKGQLPPQPPSEATWARARAVDAPVDLGSLRRVRLRQSAICRATAASEGMPAGSPGASRATRAVLRAPGLSWVQWATSVRLGASCSSVGRA